MNKYFERPPNYHCIKKNKKAVWKEKKVSQEIPVTDTEIIENQTEYIKRKLTFSLIKL